MWRKWKEYYTGPVSLKWHYPFYLWHTYSTSWPQRNSWLRQFLEMRPEVRGPSFYPWTSYLHEKEIHVEDNDELRKMHTQSCNCWFYRHTYSTVAWYLNTTRVCCHERKLQPNALTTEWIQSTYVHGIAHHYNKGTLLIGLQYKE